MPVTTTDKRVAFRKLHESGCFVIPNPWDIGSARALQGMGFKALASTSAGFAWSIGKADNHVTLGDVCEHLTALCGAGVARRLILGGETIGGAEALRLGVVQWACPAHDLGEWTAALAARIAAHPRGALAAIKRCIALAGSGASFGAEIDATRVLYSSPQTLERVSAFLDRPRTAAWATTDTGTVTSSIPKASAMTLLIRGGVGAVACFSTFRAATSSGRSSGKSGPGCHSLPSSDASHFSVSCPRSRSSAVIV